MKTDELGEYDETVKPDGLEFPLSVDVGNDAIIDANNRVIARFAFSNETVARMRSKRIAEYVVMMANRVVEVKEPVSAVRNPWGRAGNPNK